MSVRWLMGLAFVWILSQIICGVIEGTFLGAEEQNVINSMTSFSTLESQGLFAIPALGWDFLSNLPRMIAFDYAFFEGGYVIVRFVLLSLSIGVIWGLLQTFGPALQQMASSLLRLNR